MEGETALTLPSRVDTKAAESPRERLDRALAAGIRDIIWHFPSVMQKRPVELDEVYYTAGSLIPGFFGDQGGPLPAWIAEQGMRLSNLANVLVDENLDHISATLAPYLPEKVGDDKGTRAIIDSLFQETDGTKIANLSQQLIKRLGLPNKLNEAIGQVFAMATSGGDFGTDRPGPPLPDFSGSTGGGGDRHRETERETRQRLTQQIRENKAIQARNRRSLIRIGLVVLVVGSVCTGVPKEGGVLSLAGNAIGAVSGAGSEVTHRITSGDLTGAIPKDSKGEYIMFRDSYLQTLAGSPQQQQEAVTRFIMAYNLPVFPLTRGEWDGEVGGNNYKPLLAQMHGFAEAMRQLKLTAGQLNVDKTGQEAIAGLMDLDRGSTSAQTAQLIGDFTRQHKK